MTMVEVVRPATAEPRDPGACTAPDHTPSAYPRPVLDRLLLAFLAIAQTVLAFAVVMSTGPNRGRTIVSFTDTRGLHVIDVPVLGLWVLGLVACGVLARRTGANRRAGTDRQ
jgi:hypothetical protein